MSFLFEDSFLVADRLPIKFIAPYWAKGFECVEGDCGLCCLTDPPPNVPKMRVATLENSVCGLYGTKTRLCRKYRDRPLGCVKYPFIIGIEQGQLSFSTCLACPSTNLQNYRVRESVRQMFSNESVTAYVKTLASCYNAAVSKPAIWANAADSWMTLGNAVRACVTNGASLPLLPRITDVSIEAVAHFLGISKPPIAPSSFRDTLMRFSGSYIATRFNSHNLCSVRTKGQKTSITLLDSDFHIVKHKKIETPVSPSCLEIDDRAKTLLRDYVNFLVNRPFTSLGAITSVAVNNRPVPFNILSIFIGNFAVFDAGATLIARRDDLDRIDADSIREIISFSDGVLCSTFNSPEAAFHE